MRSTSAGTDPNIMHGAKVDEGFQLLLQDLCLQQQGIKPRWCLELVQDPQLNHLERVWLRHHVFASPVDVEQRVGTLSHEVRLTGRTQQLCRWC
jgi:hypothetical protein